jgi:hypothetical protein
VIPAPPELQHQRSNSRSALRRRSGSTKDSTESLNSSRSTKSVGTTSAREGAAARGRHGAGDGSDEIKENEKLPVISESEPKEPEQEPQKPLDPKVIELQVEMNNLNTTHRPLPPLLDVSFEKDIYHDPLFPIREREYIELIIRMIAEVTCRKQGGLSSGGLFDSAYRTFAEIVSRAFTSLPSHPPSLFILSLCLSHCLSLSLWHQKVEQFLCSLSLCTQRVFR